VSLFVALSNTCIYWLPAKVGTSHEVYHSRLEAALANFKDMMEMMIFER